MALPDLNAAGKYARDFVQQQVDCAAWLNIFVDPDGQSEWTIPGGIQGSGTLHRFEIDVQVPTAEAGVRAINRIGQDSGKLRMRWMFMPNAFDALPGLEPPLTALDPTLSQRFAMSEGTFGFGSGADGFSSFGTGRTFPFLNDDGSPRVVVTAIGNIFDGTGKFSGLQGTYVVTGQLTRDHRFKGAILVRVVDPERRLLATDDLPPLTAVSEPDPETAYVLAQTEKNGPDQRTSFRFTPDGDVGGLNVPQDLRIVRVCFSSEGSLGIRSRLDLGPLLGSEIASVTTNPLKPDSYPGTADSPSRFQGVGIRRFNDADGVEVGSYVSETLEGRTFNMQLAGAPGQPAARFGYFGPILWGTGAFHGVEGMFVGTAGVAIAPHVFSNVFLLRLHDPEGKFRA